MKGFGNLLMIVSAFIASPFLVYFVHRFIPSAYPWVPFAIVILFAGVLGIVSLTRRRRIEVGALVVSAACMAGFATLALLGAYVP